MEGIGRGANAGRVQRKTHRRHPMLPNRPKKALTGYGLFIREFWTRHAPGGGPRAIDAMKTASTEWRNLSAQDRARFNERTAAERARYGREMGVWKEQRKALRRPPSAYAFFLQEVWKGEEGSGRTVGEMGKRASLLWAKMAEADKAVYRARQRDLQALYVTEIQRLQNGGDIDPDWRGIQEPLPVPGQVLPDDESDEEEGDFDDDEVVEQDEDDDEDE